MEQHPLYKSKRMLKNFWQEYRIFDDRVELGTLVKMITLPFDKIAGVEVANSYTEGLRFHLRGGRMGIKLDWADLHKHVVLDKGTGLLRHIAFTPDDPETFRAILEAALTRFRKVPGGKDWA